MLATEKPEAGGKRFFVVGGHFCNEEIAEIIGEAFPGLAENLPEGEALKPGDYPEGRIYEFENARSKSVLGITYWPFEKSVMDTVKNLRTVEGK